MPPVIAFVATAIAGATGLSIAAATWVATLVVNGAIMFGAQKLLGKKANFGEFMSDVSERTQTIRQSVAPRRLIYGRALVSGVLVYAQETGTKREYLHEAIVLASHEVDSILDIYVDGDLVPFDGNVPVAGNKYSGFLRVNKHLGTAAQAADADLVAESGGDWTTDHKLSGHAYLAIRIKYDEKVYPSGLPTVAAIVRGKKILDPRDGITRWTSNAALCVYDYMQDTQYGLGVPVGEFDSASVIAAANVCDEDVGLATNFTRQCDIDAGVRHVMMTTQDFAQLDGVQPGMPVSGTGIPVGAVVVSISKPPEETLVLLTLDRDPTATNANVTVTFGDSEKRYALNGTVSTDTRAGDTIEAMLSAMAGKAVFAGGKWFIHAGAYQTPTISLSEDDCRGPIQVTTKLSHRELANMVKGTYVKEADGWQVTDFKPYAPAFYLSEDDGEVLPRDIQLPFTTSHSAAQRLAKIELERLRQQIVTRWPCKLSALKVQCGDNVLLNNVREGWVDKVFEVVNFILVPYKDDKGQPCLGVDLVLRETASGVWDWADGADTVVDLAPNTTLHNPFDVTEPTGLTLLSDATTSWIDPDGAHVPRLKVSWTQVQDQYVLSGGKIRVQYKKNASGTWIDWTQPAGDQIEEFITDVEAGFAYDVRIRAETKRGVYSDWVESLNYTVNGDLVACDPVSGGVVTALPEAIRVSWTLPDLTVEPNTDLDYIELYEAGSFSAPSAGTAATFRAGKENTYLRSNVAAGATGYYWGRTVDRSKNKSVWVYLGTATAQNGVSYAVGLANTAQSTANAAVTSANGKNTSFYQAGTPTATRTGDLWFKTGTDELYEWNGSSWVLLNFKAAMISGQITTTQITDDAISTPKLAANSVTALKVGTNEIITVAANIADAVITNAKIVNLDAGKITAGNITVALNLTTGSLNAGTGANAVAITSSGMTIGDTAGRHMKLKGGVSGYSSIEFYNGGTFLGGMGLEATSGAVFCQGTVGNSLSSIGGFHTSSIQRHQSLSSSDPRTIDAPLYSGGGLWVAGSSDLRGVAYFNSHLEVTGSNKIKFMAASPTDASIQENWGVRVNAGTNHPFHVRGGAICLSGTSGGGTGYTAGRLYFTDTVYLFESGGALWWHDSGGDHPF